MGLWIRIRTLLYQGKGTRDSRILFAETFIYIGHT